MSDETTLLSKFGPWVVSIVFGAGAGIAGFKAANKEQDKRLDQLEKDLLKQEKTFKEFRKLMYEEIENLKLRLEDIKHMQVDITALSKWQKEEGLTKEFHVVHCNAAQAESALHTQKVVREAMDELGEKILKQIETFYLKGNGNGNNTTQ